ncbi:hypothetical protein M0813_10120 [Anaeramoeba flamelloides]|uniref:Uncharacterized protein n=1 Tax=Anaeramoeba flamelloides TaxID=1746091 RepID=A0ABQ8X3S1_9EUKA|nr:hypothetical protein M0813_10120 [Anaeramoeba flamelloides]
MKDSEYYKKKSDRLVCPCLIIVLIAIGTSIWFGVAYHSSKKIFTTDCSLLSKSYEKVTYSDNDASCTTNDTINYILSLKLKYSYDYTDYENIACHFPDECHYSYGTDCKVKVCKEKSFAVDKCYKVIQQNLETYDDYKTEFHYTCYVSKDYPNYVSLWSKTNTTKVALGLMISFWILAVIVTMQIGTYAQNEERLKKLEDAAKQNTDTSIAVNDKINQLERLIDNTNKETEQIANNYENNTGTGIGNQNSNQNSNQNYNLNYDLNQNYTTDQNYNTDQNYTTNQNLNQNSNEMPNNQDFNMGNWDPNQNQNNYYTGNQQFFD